MSTKVDVEISSIDKDSTIGCTEDVGSDVKESFGRLEENRKVSVDATDASALVLSEHRVLRSFSNVRDTKTSLMPLGPPPRLDSS